MMLTDLRASHEEFWNDRNINEGIDVGVARAPCDTTALGYGRTTHRCRNKYC